MNMNTDEISFIDRAIISGAFPEFVKLHNHHYRKVVSQNRDRFLSLPSYLSMMLTLLLCFTQCTCDADDPMYLHDEKEIRVCSHVSRCKRVWVPHVLLNGWLQESCGFWVYFVASSSRMLLSS